MAVILRGDKEVGVLGDKGRLCLDRLRAPRLARLRAPRLASRLARPLPPDCPACSLITRKEGYKRNKMYYIFKLRVEVSKLPWNSKAHLVQGELAVSSPALWSSSGQFSLSPFATRSPSRQTDILISSKKPCRPLPLLPAGVQPEIKA